MPEQGIQPKPEGKASDQPPWIGALITGGQLDAPIQQHGHQQSGRQPEGDLIPEKHQKRQAEPQHLPGAPGTNRELPALVKKGSVRPAMAAADPGQPPVQPGPHPVFQAIHGLLGPKRIGAYSDCEGEQVEQHVQADADQRADARSLSGLGFGVLPYQEQHQARDEDAAAQQAPAKTAIILYRRGLGYSAVRADHRLVVDGGRHNSCNMPCWYSSCFPPKKGDLFPVRAGRFSGVLPFLFTDSSVFFKNRWADWPAAPHWRDHPGRCWYGSPGP